VISTPWRFAIFVLVTIAIVWFLVTWTPPPAPPDVTYVCPLNALRDTRHGSYVLMLIPLALSWVGLGLDSQFAAKACIALALAVAVVCILIIRLANQSDFGCEVKVSEQPFAMTAYVLPCQRLRCRAADSRI
jgi:hypothetical protein